MPTTRTPQAPPDNAAGDPADFASIRGIPTDAEVTALTAGLSKAHHKLLRKLLSTLARHLGSAAAARLWLASPHAGFGEPPLALVLAGRVGDVIAAQEAIWGPNPVHA